MRKHPLLAFAATTLSLNLGASLTNAYGTTTTANRDVSQRATRFTNPNIALDSHSVVADILGKELKNVRMHHAPAIAASSAVRDAHHQALSFITMSAHRQTTHAVQTTHVVHSTSSHIATAAVAPRSVVSVPSHMSSSAARDWSMLRMCESNDNYRDDTGNGYYGAYQFTLSSWRMIGLNGLPDEASPAVQDAAAHRLMEVQGWRAWPVCTWRLGLY